MGSIVQYNVKCTNKHIFNVEVDFFSHNRKFEKKNITFQFITRKVKYYGNVLIILVYTVYSVENNLRFNKDVLQ